MSEITRYIHKRDDIKKNDLFSDDQIDGIEMSWGEDEEFGDVIFWKILVDETAPV